MTKNNKYDTTIKLLGIATTVLLLVPIVAQTQLQLVTAQTNSQNNSGEHPLPPHAAKLHAYVSQQIYQHPGWIGMMKWDSQNATIDYLGPANANPYRIAPSPLTSLTSGVPINAYRSPTCDRSGTNCTSEWKEVQDFTNKASDQSTVDFYQILNARNSDDNHWIQNGLVYDIAHIYSSTTAWRIVVDSYGAIACAEDANYPISAPLTMSSGHSIHQSIYAEPGVNGQYDLRVDDLTNNTGYITSITYSGDTQNFINLGRTTCVNSQGQTVAYSAGPEVEEHDTSNSSKTYNFNSMTFTEGYYDTTTSGKTTTVVGWLSTDGCGATITAPVSPNPAQPVATFVGAC